MLQVEHVISLFDATTQAKIAAVQPKVAAAAAAVEKVEAVTPLVFPDEIMSVYYGPRDDRAMEHFHAVPTNIRDRFLAALRSRSSLTIDNNSLGFDPCPNVPKDCVVEYRTQNSFFTKIRRVHEGTVLDFGLDIVSVVYAHIQITHPEVIEKIFGALQYPGTGFVVNDVTLRGDPLRGVLKQCVVRYKAPGSDSILEKRGNDSQNLA